MKLHNQLITPPREFSVMPFWFWNDQLREDEIVAQIADFEAHGVYGFVIHPRVGLPRDTGWMSDHLLYFYEVAIAAAQQRNMYVVLYDEGMYPSGSSSGQVVAENPAFHCRCLAKIDLSPGQELDQDHNLVALVERSSGEQIAIIDRKADSFIRGLHYIGEGPAEDEPPAADLLNPDAVKCFIRHVYDKFAERFSQYFGSTILGIFTDEPNPLGRCREQHVWPGTTGIVEHITRILGYDFTPYLAALWFDDMPQVEHFRREYLRAINIRLEETWYSQLHNWCQKHDIPLMGHPARGDEINHLRYFGVPGQDLVWRWVLPDHPSSLQGRESTQGKCSSSAMVHLNRRRNSNECCGAYGHELTWEEMNWLANWCFARGVNWLIPHAFYYSIRSHRRDERPPDVGPHSNWWHRYREYADGCRRLSWLNTDCVHVCHIAILGGYNWLAWRTAKVCFEHQRDFNYLEERYLGGDAEVDGEGIRIAGMHYQVLIMEHEPDITAKPALRVLEEAERLIWYEEGMSDERLVRRIDQIVSPDVEAVPRTPSLRVRHVVRDRQHYYLLFNEERLPLETRLHLSCCEHGVIFDPYTGDQREFDSNTPLQLGGYELRVAISQGESAKPDEGIEGVR
jgi:hypothetical protein